MHDHQSFESSLQAAKGVLVTCVLKLVNGCTAALRSMHQKQVHCRAQWTGVSSGVARKVVVRDKLSTKER